MLLRILYFAIMLDIYPMKETALIDNTQKVSIAIRKPLAIVLTISVVLVILLNLVNSLIFF